MLIFFLRNTNHKLIYFSSFQGLLGELGETIASIIPPTVDKEKISDVANTALDNPDLYQGLYNLVGKYKFFLE